MKILITVSSFGKYDQTPLNIIKKRGYEIKLNPYGRKLTKEETISLYQDDVCGVIAGLEIIDKEVINNASKLKVISRCGTGIDNIDIKEAKRKRIKIYNTPDSPSDAVAELTTCLILALLRQVTLTDREIRRHEWNKRIGSLLKGKKIGIIGMGKIGRKVAKIIEVFDTDIFYYDPNVNIHKYKKVSLNKLLEAADIVSLHAAYLKKNKHLIGKREIEKMKKDSFLINCSRGEIVDECALYSALKRGALKGAGLDVYADEPYHGPFAELDNVILTPHIGSYTKETRIQMEIESAKNLLKGMGNG
ncbi:MAG: phosphoglycerate dehydrogenase [Patescibacteria group bacterium]